MKITFKELWHYYYKTLIFGKPKKLVSNELIDYCFFDEHNGQLVLTHYWFYQIVWPATF